MNYKRFFFSLLALVTIAMGVRAANVSLTPDSSGGYYVNMVKNTTSTLTLDGTVTSFKVYDDGGASGDMSTGTHKDYLVINAPDGYKLKVDGYMYTQQSTQVTLYDGSSSSATVLAGPLSPSYRYCSINATSTGNSMMLYFYDFYASSGYEGLNLTVTLVVDEFKAPLTFEAVKEGTINIINPNGLTIEYNKNNVGWTATDANPISIDVAASDIVQLRGNNSCYWGTSDSGETPTRITATGQCYVYGNVMSLVHASDFATNSTLTEEFALAYLFAAPSNDIYQFYATNTTILNHPTNEMALPATNVPGSGYIYMFAGCQALTHTPKLPAMTLGDGCYHQMFADCAGLTVAPELPATTLTPMCYSNMFTNCSSLETAPELPATTLATGCYYGMFDGCTSLEEAPALDAETLVADCYGWMFHGCSSLNKVACYATDISAEGCTSNWLDGVAATGMFFKADDMNDWTTGTSGIPEGWTASVRIPYAIWCTGNSTLYFTYRGETLEQGGQFTPEGSTSTYYINRLWSGDDVADYTSVPAWYIYEVYNNCQYVQFESSFALCKPKNGEAWFQNMKKLKAINGMNYLDTSEMTDMSFMFSGMSTSIHSLDIAHFNTSKVTDMWYMFLNSSLYSLDLSGWDTRNLTQTSCMFLGCKQLHTLNLSGWNTEKLELMGSMFYNCQSLESLDLSSFNTSKVQSMTYLFDGCYKLESITLGSGWNTANVTETTNMFNNCRMLTTVDVSNWDMGNVTDMGGMFQYCYKINNLDVSNWNMANVTNMGYVFRECNALTDLDVSNWNTGKVNQMQYIFYNCYELNSIDVSNWNTANVTNMNYMFYHVSKPTVIDVSQWNTENVGGMEGMFEGCSGLTTLDVSHFNTSITNNMSKMFSGCSGLTSLDISNFAPADARLMNSMFKDCSQLTTLNLANFYTSNVTDMGALFSGCTALKDVFVSNLWTTTNVTTDAEMFSGCAAIVGEDGTTFNADVIDKANAHYNAGGYLRKAADIDLGPQPYAIYDGNAATLYIFHSDQTLTIDDTFTPDGSGTPANITCIIYGNAVLKGCWRGDAYNDMKKVVFEPSFSVERPTSTAHWFNGSSATSFEGLEYLNTSEVTDMSWMFYAMFYMPTLDVSMLDTHNVTNMHGMFCYSAFERLDLSNWDTSKVEDMVAMFSASAIKAVFVGERWTTAAVKQSDSMFEVCSDVIGEDGTTFNADVIDKTNAHYNAGGYLRKKHDSWTVTIPASGIGTFSADWNVSIPEGLTAHYCTDFDTENSSMSVTNVSGGIIPAETGVLLKGTPGESYTLQTTTDEAPIVTGNALVAVTVPTHVEPTDGEYTNLMLKSGEFIRIAEDDESVMMPANRAYLQITTAALSTQQAISLYWGDATSVLGIEPRGLNTGAPIYYDLQGQRVEHPVRGIYIQRTNEGNKKVIIK